MNSFDELRNEIDSKIIEGSRPARVKPPLGVMPKNIHDSIRRSELGYAIERFVEVGKPIYIEWVEEYNELAEKEKLIR